MHVQCTLYIHVDSVLITYNVHYCRDCFLSFLGTNSSQSFFWSSFLDCCCSQGDLINAVVSAPAHIQTRHGKPHIHIPYIYHVYVVVIISIPYNVHLTRPNTTNCSNVKFYLWATKYLCILNHACICESIALKWIWYYVDVKEPNMYNLLCVHRG